MLPLWAVVPAAGSGTRMAGERPKQYLDLDGRTVLERCLERLLSHPAVDGAMVVLAADDRWWPTLGCARRPGLLTAIGGSERAISVLHGLRALREHLRGDALLLVHDAARPLVRHADLDRVIAAGRAHDAGAILAAPVVDTLKRAAAGVISETLPRDGLWRALTPQVFRLELLLEALARAIASGAAVTDDAAAVELAGLAPALVEGSADNIKITTPADLAVARVLLKPFGHIKSRIW